MASQAASPEEQIILAPEERREAVLRVIRSAQHRVILSLFRCTDSQILEELAEALERKVQVQMLLTKRAKGWKKRLKELAARLEDMGADMRRYGDKGVKYHAKYVVADDGPALIASLNFTRKCFDRTCDFLLLTQDAGVVSGLGRLFEADWGAPDSSFPEGLSDRLVVGPERARSQLTALLEQARESISIIDHKLEDPAMMALLEAKRGEGLTVEVLGRGALGGLLPHGKMILVDDSTAVVGSIALSPKSLDSRREVAVVIRNRACVRQLAEFFQSLVEGHSSVVPVSADSVEDDDSDSEDSDEDT